MFYGGSNMNNYSEFYVELVNGFNTTFFGDDWDDYKIFGNLLVVTKKGAWIAGFNLDSVRRFQMN